MAWASVIVPIVEKTAQRFGFHARRRKGGKGGRKEKKSGGGQDVDHFPTLRKKGGGGNALTSPRPRRMGGKGKESAIANMCRNVRTVNPWIQAEIEESKAFSLQSDRQLRYNYSLHKRREGDFSSRVRDIGGDAARSCRSPRIHCVRFGKARKKREKNRPSELVRHHYRGEKKGRKIEASSLRITRRERRKRRKGRGEVSRLHHQRVRKEPAKSAPRLILAIMSRRARRREKRRKRKRVRDGDFSPARSRRKGKRG